MKEGLCLGAQGAADTNDKGEESQAGRAWLVGWHGILLVYCPGTMVLVLYKWYINKEGLRAE